MDKCPHDKGKTDIVVEVAVTLEKVCTVCDLCDEVISTRYDT